MALRQMEKSGTLSQIRQNLQCNIQVYNSNIKSITKLMQH